jgi:hypothetical protein
VKVNCFAAATAASSKPWPAGWLEHHHLGHRARRVQVELQRHRGFESLRLRLGRVRRLDEVHQRGRLGELRGHPRIRVGQGLHWPERQQEQREQDESRHGRP